MAKNLGPTFADEIWAAGLGGLPFSWGATDDAITGRDNLTPEQNTTLDTVIAAHDPTKKRKNIIASADFIQRFTNAEYAALLQKRAQAVSVGGAGIASVRRWDIAVARGWFDLNTQAPLDVKDDLVTTGVLTQARADEIFS